MNIPKILAMIAAPMALFFFSLITAYVLRLSVRDSGIRADYILYALYIVVALVIGGAI